MPKRNPGFPAELEKAIKARWGEKAVEHPLKDWSDEDEAECQRQVRQREAKKQEKDEDERLIEKRGSSMPAKLFNVTANRTCPRCGEYSFMVKDDLFMNKFRCCFKCYDSLSLSMAGGDLLDEGKKKGT